MDGYLGVLVVAALLFSSILADSPVTDADAATFDFSSYRECDPSNLTYAELPKLGKEYALTIEGKQRDSKTGRLSVFEADGYYESSGQRGATYLRSNGMKWIYLYDMLRNDAYHLGNLTCTPSKIHESACNAYAIFVAEVTGDQAMAGRCNFSVSAKSYLGEQGNDTVRAIPVRKWKQCVYDRTRRSVSVNYYYFNSENFTTPNGNKNVPIRCENIVLNGTDRTRNSNSTFDFTSYSDSIDDYSVFLPAPGFFCPSWHRENKTMPTFADQFSLTMLTVSSHAQEVHNMRMLFDYKKQVVMYSTDDMNGSHFPPMTTKSRRWYTTIHDYRSGLAFTMPFLTWLGSGGSGKNCTVTPIDDTSIDSESTNTTNGAVHMRSAYELFGMNTSGAIYIGERDFNTEPCYVWAVQRRTDTYITLTEFYWIKEDWTSTNTTTLAGMIRYRKFLNGSESETYRSIVTDYTVFPNALQTINVDSCIRTAHPILVTFSARVKDYSDITSAPSIFKTGIRDALSNLLNTSSLRFTDIQTFKGDPVTEPQVWVTVLEWVNVTIAKPGSQVQKPSADVVQDLRNMLNDTDLDVPVVFKNGTQNLTLLRNTLRSGADLRRPTTRSASTTTIPPNVVMLAQDSQGYSAGSMAGLAFAMIIIFGVAGLVGGFLLWKRNPTAETGIAYQVYN